MLYKISEIEKKIIQAFSFINIAHLEELPDSEEITYNLNAHRDSLISELNYDFSKINYNGELPLVSKKGKCHFCHPNNNTYFFHNPDTNQLIIRAVIDMVSENNFVVKVCENKPKVNLKTPEEGYPF